jgi:TrpR-related protein YerC/YecD
MKPPRKQNPADKSARCEALYEALACLRSADECRAFLEDLCTPAEIEAMCDRWVVVGWLQRGLPYREIHQHTGVSVTTIARVARYLAAGHGGYQTALKRQARRPKRTNLVEQS